jgi:dynein heavy chain
MLKHICTTSREMVKTQKTYRSKLRQQVAENYPQKFKGNIDDPDFANLPAPMKLCLKTIESIKDFRVSIILTKK